MANGLRGRSWTATHPIHASAAVSRTTSTRQNHSRLGARTVEEDALAHLLVANTHDWALFFTNRGRVFSSKVHQVPDAGAYRYRPR